MEQRTLVQRYVGGGGHERYIPSYTANRAGAQLIFDAMSKLKSATFARFRLNLRATCPKWQSEEEWLLFDATPQQIALAALRAVDRIDRKGFLVR